MAKNGKKVRIFSALEVANICGVVNQTAINWIKSDYLKAFMTPGGQYRVYSDDLYHFLKSRGMRIPEELEQLQYKEEQNSKMLVVDDDAAVRRVIRTVLMGLGFEVLTTEGGEEGERILRGDPEGIRAVILDLTMPGIDGIETFRALRRIRDDLPVLFYSGYSEIECRDVLSAGSAAFLQKPFTRRELSSKLRGLLNEKDPEVPA